MDRSKKFTEFQDVCTTHMDILCDCIKICDACSRKCLEEGHTKTAAICAECSEICDLGLKAHCCNFEMEGQIMELCSEICERCADECEKMDAKHCQECAEICRECAEACAANV